MPSTNVKFQPAPIHIASWELSMERLALEPCGAFKRRHGSLRLKGKPPPQPLAWSHLAVGLSNLGIEQALFGQRHLKSAFRNAVSALMISRAPHGKAHVQPIPRNSPMARHIEKNVLMLAREALLASSMYNTTLADALLPVANKELAAALSSTPLLNLEKARTTEVRRGVTPGGGGGGGSAVDSIAGLSALNASMASMMSSTPNVSSLARDPSGASLSHALTRRSPLAHTADVRMSASQSQASLLEETGAPHLKASKSLENLRRAHAVPPLQQQQQQSRQPLAAGGRPAARGMGSKKRSTKRLPSGGTPSMESLHSGTVLRVGKGDFKDISDSSFLQQYSSQQ